MHALKATDKFTKTASAHAWEGISSVRGLEYGTGDKALPADRDQGGSGGLSFEQQASVSEWVLIRITNRALSRERGCPHAFKTVRLNLLWMA
jgi:hypothetical protein